MDPISTTLPFVELFRNSPRIDVEHVMYPGSLEALTYVVVNKQLMKLRGVYSG